jgi:beta-galactosidase
MLLRPFPSNRSITRPLDWILFGLTALVLLGALSPFGHAADGREKLSFNPDWKFIKADPSGAEKPQFNDSKWETVSAPHTFNDVDTFDNWSPPKHVGEMELWAGRTWYRKTFTPPEEWRGKRVVLEFEGVRQIAEVYLNGERLGTNKNGFVPFGFDLTPHLQFGKPNVIALMCDNTFTKELDFPRIAKTALPWHSPHWHPAHGGIYRNVWLYVLNPVHITLPLYSDLRTTGAYAYATDVTPESAKVGLEAQVKNHSTAPSNVALKAEVLDKEGNVVVEGTTDGTLAGGEEKELKVSGELAKPHLWEPAYPYLYTVRLTLSADGKPVDQTQVPLGARSAKWDLNTGFSINGRNLKLKGWGQKPTNEWAGLGAAFPDWMQDYTLRLIREANGNFVRWGHCAGGPAQIAAADRLGIVTMQPGVDGEGDAVGDAWTTRAAAFRDMVIYYRNHPSILVWEGGNQSVSREHAIELRGYVEKYDPHGGRMYAHRRANNVVGEFMDITIGTEGSHEQPQLPVVEGEYNREEAPRRAWDRKTPGFENYHAEGSYDLTAEEFAANQVRHWVTKLGAPSHSGGANWIFSDSTSGGRVSTEVTRTSGEIDAVRLPKEAYYVCAAMWSDEPAVHVIGHWNYPAGTVKPVFVVSNLPKVELFVNGKSLGFGKVSDRHLFTFDDVKWEPGEIKAVASDDGGRTVSQAKQTAGAPVALKLTAMTAPGGLRATGSDVVLVDVEAVDKNGVRSPTFNERVDFEMSGPGVWRGGYNSGKIKSTNNTFLDIESGINRVAIRSTLQAGKIVLRAKSKGVQPASIEIESLPVEIAHGATAAAPPVPEQAPLAAPPPPSGATTTGAESAGGAAQGDFIDSFSYSGPTGGASVQRTVGEGKKVYADSTEQFGKLPEILISADYLQLPQADRVYSAVDLIGFSMKKGGVVYIAHDDRLPRPQWLKDAFTETGEKITLNRAPMSIFKRVVREGEMLTLGSNSEASEAPASQMYLVFAKAAL